MIFDSDGFPLTVGAQRYNNLPTFELSEQIVIQVEVGDSEAMWEAALDLTSPYLTLSRALAKRAGIHLDMPEDKRKARIQGTQMYGKVYPVKLRLLADEGFGESLDRDVDAFVPDAATYDPSPLPPIILGNRECLSRFFTAVDPVERLFYFG